MRRFFAPLAILLLAFGLTNTANAFDWRARQVAVEAEQLHYAALDLAQRARVDRQQGLVLESRQLALAAMRLARAADAVARGSRNTRALDNQFVNTRTQFQQLRSTWQGIRLLDRTPALRRAWQATRLNWQELQAAYRAF